MSETASTDLRLGILTNAIGFVLGGGDPSATDDDAHQIIVDESTVALAGACARRALRQLNEYDSALGGNGSPKAGS